MKRKKQAHPPKWATQFLRFYCRPQLQEDLQGDLFECFHRNLVTRGVFAARLIYIIDVLKFMRSYTMRKPKLSNPFSKSILLGSYVKTSGRSILRSKLFSAVNIFGLAISMSVGLLVIALLADFQSYDSWLKNKDRIFRIVSTLEPAGQPPVRLATTPWKAGILMPGEIPGIESIALLRRGFNGDAKIGGNTLPVTGIYANAAFFDVFSFPLLHGVASTALREPYSLVLTQTTATKLFGNADPMGKAVKIDTVNYVVTGVLQDIPRLSHIKFEMLVSLSSIDLANATPNVDGDYMDWNNVYSNYTYILLSKNGNPAALTAALNKMNQRENASLRDRKVELSVQRLKDIVIGRPMANEIGPVMNIIAVLTLAGLALIIILSACFNYTNLSIARSLKRSREVGIRKVIGARRWQVMGQFIAESVIISLLSLGFAFVIFLLLRGQLLSFHPLLQTLLSLRLSPQLIGCFILLALTTGLIAGILPALFYSKINAVLVLKDASSVKLFRHLTLRKALVVIQYSFSLIFITATVIGYSQYKGFLRFDLGFSTENILNIKMQGNKDGIFTKQLAALPAVKGISRSLIVSSLGSTYGSSFKYHNPLDSAQVDLNYIDETYLSLHKYTLVAGRNFIHKPADAPEAEAIVNEQLIRRFDIGHNNPEKALGETISIKGMRLTIVGVLKDFHYGTLENPIEPTAFRYSPEPGGYINVKLDPTNLSATLVSVKTLWNQLDKVHPLEAEFYDDQIARAYSEFSVLFKVIGFFALLAICISSLGLFGMVIYTMEKRVKEISIRKVLGAGEGVLVYLLSKGFLLMLFLSALIALPLTWLFFEKIVLARFAYHQPIGFGQLFSGLFVVAAIAFGMIGVQTLKIVRANPARVLKTE